MSVLTVIPARGGSKRLPNKNLLPFAGKPLIQWTIKAARIAGCNPILVSTDSPEIAARCVGATVVNRPPELAQDDTPTIDVLRHALDWASQPNVQFDWVLCLQPTSPLRGPLDIEMALSSICSACGGKDPTCQGTLVSVTATHKLGSVGGATFKTNGAIYMVHRNSLLRGSLYGDEPVPYYMPPERSIDIDTREDFERAEAIWNSELANPGLVRVAGHT